MLVGAASGRGRARLRAARALVSCIVRGFFCGQ